MGAIKLNSVINPVIYSQLKYEGLSDLQVVERVALHRSRPHAMQQLRGFKKRNGITTSEEALTPAYYIELKNKGYKDLGIAKKWGVNRHWLNRFKDIHDLKKRQAFSIDKQGYLELKEDGVSDEEIMDDFNLTPTGLRQRKGRWGLLDG